MWEEIGIDTQVQRIPYAALGPQIVAREFYGANCHGTGGRVNPWGLHPIFHSGAGFSGGSDHPIMDALLDEMLLQIDDEGALQSL